MKSLTILNIFVAYILLVAILQSYFCIDFKLVGFGFLLYGFILIVTNSRKINIEKSDIVIVFLVILLNIYYTLIELRGTIFSTPSYMLLLSITLSKVVLPNVSPKSYLSKVDFIFRFLLIGLFVEYLLLATIGAEIFSKFLTCNAPGVQGYRTLHNFTSSMFSFSIPGLNSIMMGAQTSSQLAVIIFTWYFSKYRDTSSKSVFFWLMSVLIMLMSPSNTAIILFVIVVGIFYLLSLKEVFNNRVKNFNKLYLFLIIFCSVIYFLYEFIVARHQSFSYIFNDLILAHLSGFYDWSLLELLFGASYDRINSSFVTTEIMFLQQLALYGFSGLLVFYLSVTYYLIRVMTIKTLINSKKLMIIPITIVITIFILGNVHYYVLFQAGVRELFSFLLAYIIYQGSYSGSTSKEQR